MNLTLLILSEWAYFITDFCYCRSREKLQISSSPLVEPVIILGADPGIVPTRGWMSTPHILEGDFMQDIYWQKSGLFGFIVFHIFPYPLEPTVT
jgi:hypothetical protein